MRVWLIDERQASSPSALEDLLRKLEQQAGTDLHLLGTSPFQPDFPAALRTFLPEHLDVLVINECACADAAWTQDVLSLGAGLTLVTTPERAGRLRALADSHALSFVPSSASAETLWLALVGAEAARQRELQWKKEIAQLQQRLADRIVIERAKGILIQRLHITEEQAYKKLRVLSRRQRRQIRDIAQSLLDTELLFFSEANHALLQGEEESETSHRHP